MNIVIAASEVVPFAKTGGLADVAGSIPKHISELGHDVSLFMPFYRKAKEAGVPTSDVNKTISVPMGDESVNGKLFESKLPDSSVPIYLIENDGYYDRDGLYGTHEGDYADNCERFVFFSRGVMESLKALDIKPDVIHCHDWQTGLIPPYLKTLYREDEHCKEAGSIYTIHNLAYQGVFSHRDMNLTGLPWALFNWKQLEFYGDLNLMKSGLVFADILNTVSERYAQEIQTPEYGCRLEGVLTERANDLHGVVNGIDYSVWSPEVDKLIPERYDINHLSGKQKCKRRLQQKNELPQVDVPIVGLISRLSDQKGLDLIAVIIDEMMALDLQFVILGTGDERYHNLFSHIGDRFPDKTGINLTFDEQMAHEIEAGANMFLMPSRYEPCGLNQLYSLKYGAVPIVRETGGLADTISDYSHEALAAGRANGFSFRDYSPEALLTTIRRALKVYADQTAWRQLVHNGMSQDWSWSASAKKYIKLYELAKAKSDPQWRAPS